MTNWGYDDNGTEAGLDPNDMNGPKALREAYAKLKQQNEDLNSKLTSFLEDQNKQKLASVFESLGVPGAANVYQGEADPDKAKAWVESMRGVFGAPTGAQAPIDNTPPVPPVTLQGDVAAQLQQMNDAGTQGAPLGNAEALAGRINDATSTADLINAWRTM